MAEAPATAAPFPAVTPGLSRRAQLARVGPTRVAVLLAAALVIAILLNSTVLRGLPLIAVLRPAPILGAPA